MDKFVLNGNCFCSGWFAKQKSRKQTVIVSEVENVWPTITGVQVFSIDGSSRGSPAHGKQQAYWEDTAYSIILWL